MANHDKGRWIYAELFGGFILEILCTSIAGPLVLLVVWKKYGGLPFVMVAASVGAFVIWRIVRWINSRGKNRHVIPPGPKPDAASDSSRPQAP